MPSPAPACYPRFCSLFFLFFFHICGSALTTNLVLQAVTIFIRACPDSIMSFLRYYGNVSAMIRMKEYRRQRYILIECFDVVP
jgi:ABC-type arginine transport system permease subunit